jgi:integrase
VQLSNKHNLVLYIDQDLVEKSRELGFNISKTFENHLKQLLTQFSQVTSSSNIKNNVNISDWWAGPDLNRRPLARKAPVLNIEDENKLLERFRDFQLIDLRRSKRTAYEKVWFIKKLFKTVSKKPNEISREDLRCFLKSLEKLSAATYKNALMALKVFFRDFLEMPEVVSSFKFPHQVFKPKQIISKEQLKQFYESLETLKEKTLFLLYATTGLRREEILSLKPENIDFSKRMITPNNHDGETKKSWVSFYNEEAEIVLKEYLAAKKQSRSQRLFPMQRDEVVELWKSAREKTGIDITPQKLRQWFCSEMLRLGVSETYVDAFCGRVPKSVLARHYTDFSPEKLKGIYEKPLSMFSFNGKCEDRARVLDKLVWQKPNKLRMQPPLLCITRERF